MKYPRILAAIRAAKWAVTPVTLQAIRDALSARLTYPYRDTSSRVHRAGEWLGDDDESDEPEEEPYEIIGPGVAVVEMHGIIGKNLSSFEMSCGGCDIGSVEECLTAALAAPESLVVILDIDSPGGTVSGVAEFATKIGELSAAAGKDVIAFISGQGCSAAYWIACGCAGIYCSPSSDVGSIGVYMALVDESKNWAEEGYKLVLIKAGDLKGAGMPGSTITPEQIAHWQADIDLIYGQFTTAVRAARPAIADATMQGQSFYAPRALEMGLVDKLVPDLEAMVDEVGPTIIPFSSPAA